MKAVPVYIMEKGIKKVIFSIDKKVWDSFTENEQSAIKERLRHSLEMYLLSVDNEIVKALGYDRLNKILNPAPKSV